MSKEQSKDSPVMVDSLAGKSRDSSSLLRIGVMITVVGDYGEKGYYNAQEFGLARAMDCMAADVTLYKAVPLTEKGGCEALEGCVRTRVVRIPCRSLGNSGLPSLKGLDTSLDALIYFSDIQLAVPSIASWCRTHKIYFYPYIGVLESHSLSPFRRRIMNLLSQRNLRVYRDSVCLAKTPAIRSRLEGALVRSVITAPVGLDEALLHQDYAQVPVDELKEELGYDRTDKILLYIGRMTQEKRPLEMLRIFKLLYGQDNSYRLLMVGRGELGDTVRNQADCMGIGKNVRMVERIPNSEIWKLYRAAEAFVNLNRQEIFGMSVLEAMYYECRVVAWEAPGPDSIIRNGRDGFLCGSCEEIIKAVRSKADVGKAAHERVVKCFTWRTTAEIILQAVSTKGAGGSYQEAVTGEEKRPQCWWRRL